MSDDTKKPDDADISPMEAQNEGQGRKGSTDDGPLPQTKAGPVERRKEEEDARIPEGGESGGRDDV